MKEIRTAIIGVGNCASTLIQGVKFYDDPDKTFGLMHYDVGGYVPDDIQIVAAFDVDNLKVDNDLEDAIFQSHNNSIDMDVQHLVADFNVIVESAPVLDGLGSSYREMIEWVEPRHTDPEYYIKRLNEVGAEVVVNYLPVGSQEATEFWAYIASEAGCAFINTIPVFIANDPKWASVYEAKNLPLFGDDIKSQIGATILHRELVKLCKMRGVSVDRTYQLNFGGNMDFYNMLDKERVLTKKKSKTGAVFAELEETDEARSYHNTHVSPSDFVPWMDDQKWAYFRIQGKAFGGAPYAIEAKLEVWDSPNSSGVVIDLIRSAKIALDRGDGGIIPDACAYCFKSPPVQYHDEVALEKFEDYVR